ncbi:MFS transporter [Agromyces sp. H3Y2-19a]|jgi:predicted MFS family arabinose efflux permease|uniref:MFS transporter n=1 Tax=Agromyces TaxID=33877 RepID=UPI001E393652|nr:MULTISPECIES: MFS transporter [Agromyces]MCD5345788.1 MFS transporter [Agromyces sp. S2-1-8]MDF0512154.1 MFS transporter [Agromyces chromiiresistens]
MTSSTPVSRTPAPPFPWLGLIVLAAAVFLSVTIEMLPTGLLPDMSSGLQVGEPLIGVLVTVFAATVVVLTVPLAALTRRVPRRTLIVLTLGVLALSCLLTAVAPNYPTVVATRVLGGAAHGLFWSVVGAYAGHLVPKEQLARAVSISVAGGSAAFVLGVPLGTALGQAFGWRLAFACVGVLTLVGALLVQRFLPPVRHHAGEADAAPVRIRKDPTFVPVIVVCLITAVAMVGMYTFYTYIAPYMTDVMGLPSSAISPMLLAYGIAGAVGLVLAGAVLGRRPTLGLVVAMVATGLGAAGLAAFPDVPGVGIASFLLWGTAFGALPTMLNTRLLHSASAKIRDAAASFYTTAFNTGIGGGALLGAALFGVIGLAALPWVFVALLSCSTIALIWTALVNRVHR